ncbi:MAG TPA: HD-GYP domain-containing protein [Angustibacter sp.]|nr:HD-GYP domain-containing protein [Angustibacter sp.]
MTAGRDGAWRRRPMLSALVRVVQYGIPLAVAWVAARAVRVALTGRVDDLWVVALAMSTAVGVSLLASRVTIRLTPLALLLRMTMVFPDRAPSRLAVVRRSTSASEIRHFLDGDDTTAHEAAVTMLALVTALSHHDKRTRGHSERVRLFCDLFTEELGLAEPDRARLRWAALIHDIGKLEVSAGILNKPGTLNDREWQVVRSHPAVGAKLARPLADWLGPWYPGIIQHHERFDGTGYPVGLAGEQISLAGRVITLVDAFETMTAARSYKAARTVQAARAELARCAGTHFDPALVRCFLGIALPRLLWAVGPLAFLVNAPALRWLGDGGARVVDLTGATAQAAVTTAGVTAVVATSGVASAPAVPAPATTRPAHSTPAAGQQPTRGDATERRLPAAAEPTSLPTSTAMTAAQQPTVSTAAATKPAAKKAAAKKAAAKKPAAKKTAATKPEGEPAKASANEAAGTVRPAKPATKPARAPVRPKHPGTR